MRLENTFETGLADGTTITTGNSDDGAAGNPFSLVTIGSSATCTFATAAALHGSLGMRLTLSNQNTFVRLGDTSDAFGSTVAVRFYFKFSANPAAAIHFGRILNTTSGVVLQFRLNATGTFQILNSAGTGLGTSAALSTGTWYRAEAWVTPDTSTTGRVAVRLWLGEDTVTSLLTINNTTTNLGTTGPRRLEMGRSTGNSTITVDYDSAVIDGDIGEAFVGPVTPDDIVAEPGGIASAGALGSPTHAGALTAAPGGVASAEVFGTPTAVLGNADIVAVPSSIGSQEGFGTPAVDAALTASPTGIVGSEQFGTPVANTALTASPTGVPSGEGFGVPEAVVSGMAVPDGIPSEEAFGVPAAALALVAAPASIGSAEAFGDVAVVLALVAEPVGIPSAEMFGTAQVGTVLVAVPSSIGSGEVFGVPVYVVPVVDVDLVLGEAELSGFEASLGSGWDVGDAVLSGWEAGE